MVFISGIHCNARMNNSFSPHRDTAKVDLNLVVNNLDYGDWKLLYHLLNNMDALVFSEFMEEVTKQLRKAIDEENKDDTLSMDSLLSKPKLAANPNAATNEDEDVLDSVPDAKNKGDDDEDEFLKLNDGNYLKPSKDTEV